MLSSKKNLPVKGLYGRCISAWASLPSYEPIPLPPYTLYACIMYCILIHTGKGEGVGEELTKEKVRGATFHKAGSKISTWLTVSLVYINLPSKHLLESKMDCPRRLYNWNGICSCGDKLHGAPKVGIRAYGPILAVPPNPALPSL